MYREPIDTPISADSLEVYLAPHSRRSSAIYLMVVTLVLSVAALLPILRVSVTVAGPGIIRPATEKHEVRARVSGVAAEVVTSRGERVGGGQPLIVIRSEAIDERAALISGQIAERRVLEADLDLLTRAVPSAISADQLRSSRYRAELRQLLREIREHRTRADQARQELGRATALAERNLLAAQEVEERQFRVDQLAAEEELLVGRRMSGWQVALLDLRREIDELEGQIDQLDRERELFAIEAPVSGTVEELSSIASGSFVQAGDIVAVISPDAELLAEIYLTPGDVGLIRVGMPVRLHVDAFSYHDWGYIGATVIDISDDYVIVEETPAFRIRARLHQRHLELRSGFRGDLRKGMSLQARFIVSERTLLQLLRDDVNDWLHPWHDRAGGPASAE